MTSDYIKDAIIEYLTGAIPVPVVDAEAMEELELPLCAVKITQSERLGLALPRVESVTIEIIYREHQGDATRPESEEISYLISNLIDDPSALKTALNSAIMDGVVIDMIQFSGGYPEWTDSTLQCTWQGDCYAQRGTNF